MKVAVHSGAGFGWIFRRARHAFTFTELMVASAIFLLLVGGMISSELFGLRLYEITRNKLGAVFQARKIMNALNADIHSAATVRAGQGDLSSFTAAAPSTAQQGNAIQIVSAGAPPTFVRYYQNAADKTLRRTTDALTGTVIADGLTNSVVFTVENFAGIVLSNAANNAVIGVNLQFDLSKNAINQLQLKVAQRGEE